ncbi:hypothetical protein ACS0TY_010939 [Phlomoides rotata]
MGCRKRAPSTTTPPWPTAITAPSPAASPFLTFLGGNDTYRLSSLGFLHYSVVTVGTPPLTFLVALDTGCDLFWLPYDCTSCAHSLNSSSASGRLNIYSSKNSSTSLPVPCNSTKCGERRGCACSRNACAYQEVYLSSNTSSTGILVDDVLHLGTDANPQKPVNASITLGYICFLFHHSICRNRGSLIASEVGRGHGLKICVLVRVLRTWEARNFKRNKDLMSVDFLLLDEKDCLIQGSIHHQLLYKFMDNLREGGIFLIR